MFFSLLFIDRVINTLNVKRFSFLIKERNPRWQVALKKALYVESVEITDKIDCCPHDIGIIKVTVSTSPASLDPTCAESMEYGGNTQVYKFHCSPPALGSYVTVTLTGDNVTLVLCQVFVKTIGELYELPPNCYLASNPSN